MNPVRSGGGWGQDWFFADLDDRDGDDDRVFARFGEEVTEL
jgi:hypothetical protein